MSAGGRRQQEVAFERVKHLPADEIKCRYCGETTSEVTGWRGFAHRLGPHGNHRFIAARPTQNEETAQ